MLSKKERIFGGMWGLLVGDAVGVPYEFHTAEEIKKSGEIDIQPPEGFGRTYSHMPIGTWSDDGAQALCLLDSLINCGEMNIKDFAERLTKWYDEGLWAVDNVVFDVGNQTSMAILAYKSGKSPTESGMVKPDGKGNGALMRVLPLALWQKGTDERLVEDAHRQSMVTHGHICNQVCCALYCLWARRILKGIEVEAAYDNAVKSLRNIYPSESEYRKELEWSIRPDDEIPGSGSGYVVDSLRSARMVLKQDSYEEVIKSAIVLGNDTDTTAAVAGGLAGLRDGINAIPEKWISKMRGKDMVEPLLYKLLGL